MIKRFKQYNESIKLTNENVQTELVIEVTDKNDAFINMLIDKMSFVYRKRKDRHVRPIKITGDMSSNINLTIVLSNKDIIKLEYIDKEDLKIHINTKLVYYDDIEENKIMNKVHSVYSDYLNEQKFKVTKNSPFN